MTRHFKPIWKNLINYIGRWNGSRSSLTVIQSYWSKLISCYDLFIYITWFHKVLYIVVKVVMQKSKCFSGVSSTCTINNVLGS